MGGVQISENRHFYVARAYISRLLRQNGLLNAWIWSGGLTERRGTTSAPLSATLIYAKCKRSFLHKSHSTPDVVFLMINIYMRTAVPRTKKGKSRSTLGAIFSAPWAAKAAMFGRLVATKNVYRVSKNFPYYYFWFLIIIRFWKKGFFWFLSKILNFLENIFIPFRKTVHLNNISKFFSYYYFRFGATPSGIEVR